MSLNYNEPDTAAVVQESLESNPSITTATLSAISGLLGNPAPTDPIVVGSMNAAGEVVAPEGQTPQIVVVDIDEPAGTDVDVVIPESLATNQVWVFDTDANINVRFNTVERVIQSGNGDDVIEVTGDKNTTIDGAGGNDDIATSGGDDSISGSNGNDTIDAGAGNDTIAGVLNFDTIDGGAGFDVVMLPGTLFNWSGDIIDGSIVLGSTTAQGASEDAPIQATMVNVELVQFGAVAQELEQFSYYFAAEEGTDADAMRLYQTALGRSADIEGAQFWLDAVEAGVTVAQLAADFAGSDEFASIWADVSTNEELVTQIYQNAFGEDPDQAGLDFWVAALDDGLSAGEFIAEIAMSDRAAETITNVVVIGDIV